MKEIAVEQGSHEWLQLRLGKITGTRFEDVLGTPKAQQGLICELVAERLTEQGKEIRVNEAMERGKIEEPFARKAYEERTGNKVSHVGFIIADHIDDRVGLSPDGAVRDEATNDIIGGIEIKNPDSKTHVSYLIEGIVPKDYAAQVMLPFIVIPTLQWMDFVSYDARIKLSNARLMIKRVTREELDVAGAEAKLRDFMARLDKTYEAIVF